MPAAKKGKPGRKPGVPNSEKPFKEALRIALLEKDEATGHKKLRRVAEALITKAMSGDVPAIKEIADRTDGKTLAEAMGEDEGTEIRIIRITAKD